NDGTATATVTDGTAPYTYLWDDPLAQTTPTATGLTQGTYTVTVTDDNGCTATESITLTDPGTPLAVIVTVDQHVSCFGGNDGEATATVTGGELPYTYLWNDPAAQTTPTATGLAAGPYTVTVTDNAGTIVAESITITQPDAIVATATVTDAACDQLTGAISVNASGGSGSFEYMLIGYTGWQIDNTFTNLATGTYDVTIRDAAGCEFTLIGVEVGNIPGPSIIDLHLTSTTFWLPNGGVGIVADGTALPLVYSITGNGIDWQPSPEFIDLAAGPYVAWVMDANGCMDSAPFEILNQVEGDVTISAETKTFCMNKPVIILVNGSKFIEISSFFIELEFDPTVLSLPTLENINPLLAPGIFSQTVGNNILQIRFTIFDGSVTVPNGENLFDINFEALSPGVSPLSWNLLSCEIFESAGHQVPDLYVEGEATINPAPLIYATGSGEYCEDDLLTLQAGSLDGENPTYTWTGPTGYTHHDATWQLGALGMNDNGQFTVRAINEFLCSDEETVDVLVNPKPLISLGYADTVCFGQPLWLDPHAGAEYENYLWHDGSTNETMLATEPGLYWVSVMDTKGCSAADSVLLEICSIDIIVPNAFTPDNGDELNDEFKPIITGWEPGKYYMQVFNRWGELLFETNDYNEGWDGTYKGQLVAPGLYSYIIVFEAPSYITRLISSPVSGSVTVIR
ncbi:MAG: gliding motility-associated C-terminal domain-containing protein, partial [Lentimicrobium sp.]|nr:gliding motility-associated C-terminal domain-containing protein [Lentimicrobium sp.]